MTVREKREELEKYTVGEYGVAAAASKGRQMEEAPCAVRTCFQRDVDRIIHTKAFRRLKHKTQVFLQPEGDHYRTRLTHTLEVARIARTISRALMLNEDLTEAIALGHDLGHTPFGHAGERALNELIRDDGGFRHYEQSLRVVDRLEKGGRGLNLTYEVRDGILRHTIDPPAATREGRVVRLSDRIAYICHDIDDAVRAGLLSEDSIPAEITSALGASNSSRINTITSDVIKNSADGDIKMSPEIYFVTEGLHNFLYENVYKNPKAKSEETKVLGILEGIFNHYIAHPEKLPEDYRAIAKADGLRRAVCDYISGMTDKYAIDCYSDIFIPSAWSVR